MSSCYICAYVGLPISTAMVQDDEMCDIPHHCLGVIPPESYVTVTTYQKYAHETINTIHNREFESTSKSDAKYKPE